MSNLETTTSDATTDATTDTTTDATTDNVKAAENSNSKTEDESKTTAAITGFKGSYRVDQRENNELFDLKTKYALEIKSVANKEGCFSCLSYTLMRNISTFRTNIGVRSTGRYYYEVEIGSKRVMYLGFGLRSIRLSSKSLAVGGDPWSWSFDGFKCKKWNNKVGKKYGNKFKDKWEAGDVIGCGIDLDEQYVEFWMNGKSLGKAFEDLNINSVTSKEEHIAKNSTQHTTIYPYFSLTRQQSGIIRFNPKYFKFPMPQGYLPFKYDVLDQDIMQGQVGSSVSVTTNEKEKVNETKQENKENGENMTEERKIRNQQAGYKLCSLLVDNKPQEFLKELELIDKSGDFGQKDYQYFFDEMRYTWADDTMISNAAVMGYLDILKLLVEKYKVDINGVSVTNGKKDTTNTKTALFYACRKNHLEMIDYLLSNGANASNPHLGSVVASNGSIEAMKMILNMDGKYKHSWDWDKNINIKFGHKSYDGRTTFLSACWYGSLDFLKFLLEIEPKYKTKMDKTVVSMQLERNGLMWACMKRKMELATYLVNNVYCEPNSSNNNNNDNNDNNNNNSGKCELDINNLTKKYNSTVFSFACTFGNVELMEALVKNFGNTIDFNQKDYFGRTGFFRACAENQYELVEWLMKDEFTKNKIDFNAVNDKGTNPFQCAISENNFETCELLAQSPLVDSIVPANVQKNREKNKDNKDNTENKEIENKSESSLEVKRETESGLDFAAFYGNIRIFSLLAQSIFLELNINDMKSLNESGLFCEENIEKWKHYCEEEQNTGFITLLNQIINSGIKKNNFQFIQILLDANDNDKDEVITIDKTYSDARKSIKIAQYLFNNLKKESLIDISKTVNNGLAKQECGFDDCLLFLSKLVNSESFNRTIENVTKSCLVNEFRNVKKYEYFKNNLLHSNIWAKNAMDESDDSLGVRSVYDDSITLFEQVNKTVCLTELEKQQMLIKTEMLRIETQHKEAWEKLINLRNHLEDETVSQTYIGVNYVLKQIPNDIVSGYLGTDEYDYNGYLTRLLIVKSI